MVRPDLTKWNQSIDDLLQGSINAQHPRTRERYLAIYIGNEHLKLALPHFWLTRKF